MARLEHINITVPDPNQTAQRLIELFGWHIRWSGEAINGGHTVHVGNEFDYIALYTGPGGGAAQTPAVPTHLQRGGMNHIGVVVNDLDAVEAKVRDMGMMPNSHMDYEPGKRFYFDDPDGIEFEVVSYAP